MIPELISLANLTLTRCVRCQSNYPEYLECIGGGGCETCEYQYAKELALAMFNAKY